MIQYLSHLNFSYIFAGASHGSSFYSIEAIVFVVVVLLVTSLVGFWEFGHYFKTNRTSQIPSIGKELNRQAARRKFQNEYCELEVRST